jgi:hypothetical protein
LYSQIAISMPRSFQRICGVVSLIAMGGLIAVQLVEDVRTLRSLTFAERISRQSLTSLELVVTWSLMGALIYVLGRRLGARDRHDYDAALADELDPDGES